MPLGYHPRRRNNNRRRRRTARRGKKTTKKEIEHLQRQVRKLSTQATKFCQFDVRPEGSPNTGTGIDLAHDEFYVSCLTRPNAWVNIFQTTTEQMDIATQLKMLSYDLQFVFSPQNSLEPLTPRIVDVWLYKLKSETAMDVLAETSQMSSSGMTAANNDVVHKSIVAGGAYTMIAFNPASFNIIQHRQFTVANILEETGVVEPLTDTVLANTGDALTRCRMRGRFGNELKVPKGKVLEMAELDTMPLDRYYVCVHVGGWAGGTSATNGIRMDTNWTINTKVYI